jgi:hypothetical protein
MGNFLSQVVFHLHQWEKKPLNDLDRVGIRDPRDLQSVYGTMTIPLGHSATGTGNEACPDTSGRRNEERRGLDPGGDHGRENMTQKTGRQSH